MSLLGHSNGHRSVAVRFPGVFWCSFEGVLIEEGSFEESLFSSDLSSVPTFEGYPGATMPYDPENEAQRGALDLVKAH